MKQNAIQNIVCFSAEQVNETIMMETGVDVNFNKLEGTSLIEAAESGKEKHVEMLIAAGADVNVQHEYGPTALISAARWHHDKCVDILIAAGADVNLHEEHCTALMEAAYGGNIQCVEKLIAAGADVNAGGGWGFLRTSLHSSTESSNMWS